MSFTPNGATCPCCPEELSRLSCDRCGGNDGGGRCLGAGRFELAFRGCTCETGGTSEPDENVCPEDRNEITQSCRQQQCGGSLPRHDGICNTRTYIDGLSYKHCACCPEQNLGCDACGGDIGDGHCKGIEEYIGVKYSNCTCTPGGGGDVPIPPIPFPIPLLGFPPVPPGTPNPKKLCPATDFSQCSSCEGKDGWCQNGESVGCPCREECPEADDDQPNCDDDTCKAPEDNKVCSQGPQHGCTCKREAGCPNGSDEDFPQCLSEACGGSKTADLLSTCYGGDVERFKDCRCIQYGFNPQPYAPFTDVQLAFQQQVLDGLVLLNEPIPIPSVSSSSHAIPSSSSPPTGPATLTCSPNNVANLPHGFHRAAKTLSRNEVLYALREMLCSNQCAKSGTFPSGASQGAVAKGSNGGCELSVVLQGGFEAYFVRDLPSEGDQWQQCWDATQSIIESCVQNGPNGGWQNGPNPGQFYEGGFRNLNQNAVHSAFDGSNGLQPDPAVGIISPATNDGITCGTGVGDADIKNCLSMLRSITWGAILDPNGSNERFCTDSSQCLQKGRTGSADGQIIYSQFCRVTVSGSCAFVAASKDPRFGIGPGKSCFSTQQMWSFVQQAANNCPRDSNWAVGFKPGDQEQGQFYTVFGVLSKTNPGAVFVP